MIHKKLLSLLVLLMTVASGAWAAITTEDIGKVICTDGSLYATKNAATTDGKTAAAMIAYIDTENNKALAIALTDGNNNMDWTQASEYCTGLNTSLPVPNGTWVLPTEEQWKSVLTLEEVVPGYEAYKSESLNTKLNAAKGNALDNDGMTYWSATELSDGNYVQCLSFNYGMASFSTGRKAATEGSMTRAFLEIELSGIEVTTNAAQAGDFFTEASFNMPAYDATVDYELVRDMAQLMTTKVGDAADGADYRIRLRKDGSKWELADIGLDALKALITVHDVIENENLACFGQDAVCTLQIFAIDDNDQPTGDAISFANLEPGRYKAKAVAKADGDYIGETALSNVIVLFQGYEVKVPAKEMITYYKDEPLYADTETSGDAELYTISSVSGDQVVLSDAIETAPSNTPLLVYNKGDQDKTFLLIPVDAEPNLALTVFSGFKGTLVARTTDDTSDDYGPWNMAANTKYYGCNGNDFVWIKNAGDVDAHRCWIEISTANAPSRLTIVFEKEEATGVNEVSEVNEVSDDSWYDLSGRKLDGEPTTKGVYIKDGKKVIIK